MDSGIVLQRAQRALKAVLALSIGAFGLVTGLTNIVDYDANWEFVRRVLGMEGFPDWFDAAALSGRAIASEAFHRWIYVLIIAGELVTGLLFLLGGILLAVSVWRSAPPQMGKVLVVLGGIVAMLIWYLAFSVIASEWFVMWVSAPDAQMAAYNFAIYILVAIFYITQPE